MPLRRLAVALVAIGVVITTMGVTAAATGDRAFIGRQIAPDVKLAGTGASFPCGYIERAIEDAADDDLTVAYECTGSGAGRSAFIAGTVDFAGTDVPLSDAEVAQLSAKGASYVQFAYVGGGIAIAYNPGSGIPYNLKLSADTLGKVFTGKIVKWNDPQLVAENPGASLPDLRLRVAVRADSSGTSNGFTAFMSQMSTSWTGATRNVFNSPPLPDFPGMLAVDGSDGVADAVRDNPGMIGYMELSFASERRLSVAAVGVAGGFVLPDTAAVSQTIASLRLNADGTVSPNFATLQGYPLAVVTYLLVRQDNGDRQTAANLRAFADLLLSNNSRAASLAYAPASPEHREVREAADHTDRARGSGSADHDDDHRDVDIAAEHGASAHCAGDHRRSADRSADRSSYDRATHQRVNYAGDGFDLRLADRSWHRAHRRGHRPDASQPPRAAVRVVIARRAPIWPPQPGPDPCQFPPGSLTRGASTVAGTDVGSARTAQGGGGSRWRARSRQYPRRGSWARHRRTRRARHRARPQVRSPWPRPRSRTASRWFGLRRTRP